MASIGYHIGQTERTAFIQLLFLTDGDLSEKSNGEDSGFTSMELQTEFMLFKGNFYLRCITTCLARSYLCGWPHYLHFCFQTQPLLSFQQTKTCQHWQFASGSSCSLLHDSSFPLHQYIPWLWVTPLSFWLFQFPHLALSEGFKCSNCSLVGEVTYTEVNLIGFVNLNKNIFLLFSLLQISKVTGPRNLTLPLPKKVSFFGKIRVLPDSYLWSDLLALKNLSFPSTGGINK